MEKIVTQDVWIANHDGGGHASYLIAENRHSNLPGVFLEKHSNMVVLTKSDFIQLIAGAFTSGLNFENADSFYHERGIKHNLPDKTEYLTQLFK